MGAIKLEQESSRRGDSSWSVRLDSVVQQIDRFDSPTVARINANGCPFCSLPRSRVVEESTLAVVIRDEFPVAPGHTLVIPRRHVGSFFDITDEERAELFALVASARQKLDDEFRPDGYNIGINDGAAAGQTVPHLHIHLIPRYRGDHPDPRGGVRWIFPEKADYWSPR